MNTRAHWRLILGLFALLLSAGIAFTLASANSDHQSSTGFFSAPVQPVTLLLTAKSGGVVAEVFAVAGSRIAKGAPLLRFDTATLIAQRGNLTAALRATRGALQTSKELFALPQSLRSSVIEVHPDVTAAEERYVRSVAALDRDPSSPSVQAAWQQAATERTQVRERLSQSLANSSATGGLAAMIPVLESRLHDLDQAIAASEIRSPFDAEIDIFDLHPGDRLLPGTPAASLLLPGEYFCEFPVPVADSAHLKVGTESSGWIGAEREYVRWRIESLTLRTIPVGLRENRHIAQERLVRARFSATASLRGTIAVLRLPTPGASQ